MNLVKFLIHCALSLICLASCSPYNYDNDDTSKPNSVSVLNEDFIKYVTSIDTTTSETTYSIKLSESIPIAKLPKIGDIIILPQCKLAEFGFAGIVQKINNKTEIVTEIPSLDQLCDKFSLSTQDFDLDVYDVQNEVGEKIDYTYEKPNTRSVHSFENIIVRFPFALNITDSSSNSISGDAYLGFNSISLNFLKEPGKPMVTSLEIEPCAGLNINSTIGVKANKKNSKKIGQVRFSLKALLPGGIPIIIPITFYAYAEIELNGEISVTFSLNPHFDGKYTISSENGEWNFRNDKKSTNQDSPWMFSSLDMQGSIDFGMRCGVLVGLYSASSGIGLNFIPKYSISANASLNSKDLFKINPLVLNSITINSEAYCLCSFFGKELAKYRLEFPSAKLWEEKLTLFPEIMDFSATTVDKINGLVSYIRNKHFFLESISASEGLSLFIEDEDNFMADYSGENVREDDNCIYKEQRISNLEPNTTYFACPYYKVFNKKFYGESKRFTTEETFDTVSYKISIVSCERDELIPPETTFYVDVAVDSEGKFKNIINTNNYIEKKWFKNLPDPDSDIIEELGLIIDIYNGSPEARGCINDSHSHSGDESGFHLKISYKYTISREPILYTEFFLNSKCGSFTPCYGFYYYGGNRLYPTIFKSIVYLERIN